jgi:hypothetical protein
MISALLIILFYAALLGIKYSPIDGLKVWRIF